MPSAADVLKPLAGIEMLDVYIPTVDGRWLILLRYTQPESEAGLIGNKLKLDLPAQPLRRITTGAALSAAGKAS